MYAQTSPHEHVADDARLKAAGTFFFRLQGQVETRQNAQLEMLQRNTNTTLPSDVLYGRRF